MKIGIIGIGNIGRMLTKRILEFMDEKDVFIFNRSVEKYKRFENLGLNIANSIKELNEKSDIIFLCVKPQDLKNVLDEIKITNNKIFVTTIAAVSEETYYKKLGKINLIRIIPSMINKIGGPILFYRGKYADKDKIKVVKEIINKIGVLYEVEKEEELDIYTHLTSCFPALISEFIKLYIESLSKEESIDKNKALDLVIDTLKITSLLLEKERFDIIPQVATKGGITEKGIKIMEKYKSSFFEELVTTLSKRMKEIREKIDKEFK